jgi:vancomycin resistance protein YoaR
MGRRSSTPRYTRRRDRRASLEGWGREGREGRRSGFGAVGLLIFACALIAVAVAADYRLNQDRIYRGIYVGSIDVGGLSPSEAERLVRERSASRLDEITFRGPGDDVTLTAERLGIQVDVGRTVSEAYSVGRSGSILERLGDRFEAATGGVRVDLAVTYDEAAAEAAVQELAGRLDRPPRDAAVSLDGGTVEVRRAESGYRMDREATLANVRQAVDEISGEVEIVGEVLRPAVPTSAAREAEAELSLALQRPLVLRASEQDEEWTFAPAQVAQAIQIQPRGSEIEVSLSQEAFRSLAADMYATLNVPARDAEFEVVGNSVEVIPSQTGLRLQEERFFTALSEGLFQGQHRYELPVVVAEPELTTARAERLKPTTLIGQYRTNYMSYDDDPGRVKNLQIASNAINDTLLAPGEVFSFNALAAPLSYEEAKVIVDGRVETADGGGLCQVSSTLYMAANYAGLDVIERHPHYAELPYIRPGFDATVWFGALDMKFQNTTDGYILIKQQVDESTGDVISRIYGRPTGLEVEMRSEKVFDGTDAEGNPMTRWVTYQRIERGGEVVFDGVLHEDTYRYLKPAETNRPAT